MPDGTNLRTPPPPKTKGAEMARTYVHTLSLSLGGDEPTWEGEATITYKVNPGRPETPPSYSHGWLPADPAEVVDVIVTHIDGEVVTAREYGKYEAETLETHIECSDDILDELYQAAVEEDFAAREAAAEIRAEERWLEER